MNRILIVEDERHLADGLRFNLEADEYDVAVVESGEAAISQITADSAAPDLVILDVMLPGMNGFAVAAELRQLGIFVPILMLTARGRAEDVLKGFEAGADDYLPKPFELAILLARVRGLLRRSQWTRTQPPAAQSARTLDFHGRIVDLDALELKVSGHTYQLTQMECDLLAYLIRNSGKAVSRKSILEDVWALHEDTDTRAIDNFIVRLRRYLEDDPSRPQLLLTVRGVGYKAVP
jgi:DNA-binding response OmpR family regulator